MNDRACREYAKEVFLLSKSVIDHMKENYAEWAWKNYGIRFLIFTAYKRHTEDCLNLTRVHATLAFTMFIAQKMYSAYKTQMHCEC